MGGVVGRVCGGDMGRGHVGLLHQVAAKERYGVRDGLVLRHMSGGYVAPNMVLWMWGTTGAG